MKDLKQKFKKIYFIGQYPEMDWQRLFILFIIVAFFVGCWSVYNFYEIKGETFSIDTTSVSARTETENKEKEVQAVVNMYQKKEQRYQELQGNTAFKSVVSTSTQASSTSVN